MGHSRRQPQQSTRHPRLRSPLSKFRAPVVASHSRTLAWVPSARQQRCDSDSPHSSSSHRGQNRMAASQPGTPQMGCQSEQHLLFQVRKMTVAQQRTSALCPNGASKSPSRTSHPLTHSPTHPLTDSPTHRLTDSPTHTLTHSPTPPLIPLTHSPTHPTHPLTHSPTPPIFPLTHSPTHPLTHSPTHPCATPTQNLFKCVRSQSSGGGPSSSAR